MNAERLHQVLRRPIISEKSTNAAESGQQVVFEVSVEGVQVINVRGKIKRFGKTPGKRANWKKAYVRLADGDDIDFLGSGA